jgi:hypothetical protein
MLTFTNTPCHKLQKTKWPNTIGLWANSFIAFFLSVLMLISGKAIGQSANLDQVRNGSKTAPTNPGSWVNGNAGPTNAHFAEGYSIPYRARVSDLNPALTSHTLVIEWDTKDQNGHAIDYITHYNNMDNPTGSHQANFGHAPEVIDPTIGTTFTGAPNLFQILTPSSTGAEVTGQPATSFTNLPTSAYTGNANITKMAIWGGTITGMSYLREDNQDATTASTKTQLSITFTLSTAGSTTALLAWGGHIAAEYDWGVGRGASGVSGSPYHMRIVTIDGKNGGQDRSLKADAVFVPPPICSVTAAQTACEGSSTTLTYSYTGSTSGITNYSWTLTPGNTGAKISGSSSNTVSGTNLTSINIVPTNTTTGYATGTFSLSLTITNLGGSRTCNTGGTINQASTANAGGPYTMCTTDGSVQVTGTYGGGATGGTWSAATGTFSNETTNTTTKTVTATYTPAAGATSVTLTFTANDPDGTGPCSSVAANATLTINPAATADAGGPYTMCTSDGSVQVTGTYGGGATGGTWSAPAGTGSFSNESTNTTTKQVTATFTPAAGQTSITLTFTANDPDGNGPCSSVAATANLTINPAATANAGDDQTVCASSPSVTLNGSVGGGATSGTWTTGGDGTFDDATKLNAVYTPGAADIAAGTVTLTLTTNDPTGPCGTASNDMVITITANPERPAVTYIPPECDETTFSVEVTSPTNGTYELTQDAGGVSKITKVYPTDAVNGKLIFSGLTVGKGFSIILTVGDCTSDATDCDNYKTPVNSIVSQQESVNSIQSVETVNARIEASKTKVLAAPNPFYSKIKFTLESEVSGQGSLEIYNILGQKVKTVYQGYIQKGQVQNIEYNVPEAHRSSLIYIFKVGEQRVTGKLIGLK